MPALEALEQLCGGADGADIANVLRTYAPTWRVQMPGILAGGEAAELQRTLAGSSAGFSAWGSAT